VYATVIVYSFKPAHPYWQVRCQLRSPLACGLYWALDCSLHAIHR